MQARRPVRPVLFITDERACGAGGAGMIQYAVVLAFLGIFAAPFAMVATLEGKSWARFIWAFSCIHVAPVLVMMWARLFFGSGE